MFGKLYLLPNLLDSSQNVEDFLPPSLKGVVLALDGVIAESEKGARSYLRKFISHEAMQKVKIALLNEHTPCSEREGLLEPLLQGEQWGILSDAGLPCIADPGAELISLAHLKKVEIISIPGPCSILLALQLSGFSGQAFAFHGYLEKERGRLISQILELEKKSRGATQIWIEAPYRTEKLFSLLKETLQKDTWLSIAASLTLSNQRCSSMPVEKWRASKTCFGKEPAVFLIYRKN